MKISEIIQANKNDLEIGVWKQGHIARDAFPLSRVKPKRYKLGMEWYWRLVTFQCLGKQFRILIEINENKAIYRAILGCLNDDGDLVVICSHEHHASEPGRHCHVTFSQIETLPTGVMRSALKKWPKFNSVHAQVEFDVSKINALSVTAEAFNFIAQGDLI